MIFEDDKEITPVPEHCEFKRYFNLVVLVWDLYISNRFSRTSASRGVAFIICTKRKRTVGLKSQILQLILVKNFHLEKMKILTHHHPFPFQQERWENLGTTSRTTLADARRFFHFTLEHFFVSIYLFIYLFFLISTLILVLVEPLGLFHCDQVRECTEKTLLSFWLHFNFCLAMLACRSSCIY